MHNNSLFPQMTVGVMGSAGGDLPEEIRAKCRELGKCIASSGHVLITGACPGLPHETVIGSKKNGGFVVGISPALNLEEHIIKYHSPTRCYDAIIYTGSGLMGREIENIRSCDVVIFAGGRSGTLGEFAIAYDEGKIIGILKGTGGLTNHLEEIIKIVQKDTGAQICYDEDPDALLEKLTSIYKKSIYPHYSRLVEEHNPDGSLDE